MPKLRRCRVCDSEMRPVIEAELEKNPTVRRQLRDLEKQFGISRSVLSRHYREHSIYSRAYSAHDHRRPGRYKFPRIVVAWPGIGLVYDGTTLKPGELKPDDCCNCS